jgi:uncharacterized protein (DUF1800 family)
MEAALQRRATPTSVPLKSIVFTRLAYGPTPADVEHFNALGDRPQQRLERWLDEQLSPERIDDSACDTLLKEGNFYSLPMSQEALWDEFQANNKYKEKNGVKGDNEKEYVLKYLPTEHVRAATVIRAAHSKRQLFEVLVDFWHNHFNVYPHDIEDIFAIWPSYDVGVIRKHALGNFRQMLGAVARSAAMQIYLDNATSRDEGPNENYARELLELHTLGSENYLGVRDPITVKRDKDGVAIGYVDNDVYEVARCFTGWTFDYNADWLDLHNTGVFLYKRDWHDRFNKLVLGKYLPSDQRDMKDGDDVLDILASHPGTARHVATKLCRRLIGDAPPNRVIEEAAAVFLAKRTAPDQLKQVVRAIVLSPEFRETFGEKIRRPFEVSMAICRGFNAQFKSSDMPGLLWNIGLMGAPVFGRRPPDGYPDQRAAWTHSVSMLYRWKFAIAASENWIKDDNTNVRVDLVAETPEDKRAPEQAADYWIDRLLARPAPAEMRNDLIGMLSKADPENPESYAAWITRSVQLIVMSPEYQKR